MQITLHINGEKKIFVASFVKARVFRKILELNKRINFNDLSAEDLDELVGLVCDVFGNQFTIDDFYDGLPANELKPTIQRVTSWVVNGRSEDNDGETGK